jgi:c-di-GMP-binding flagellar brake protein YcgR
MIVLSEESIPDNECLAVVFTLPDGQEISSLLVIAYKRRERFMYSFEFTLIDEKERAKIIQYMFKRQIELARE